MNDEGALTKAKEGMQKLIKMQQKQSRLNTVGQSNMGEFEAIEEEKNLKDELDIDDLE